MQIKKVIALGTACLFAGTACVLAVRAFAIPGDIARAAKSPIERSAPVVSAPPGAAPIESPVEDWKIERETMVRDLTELKLKARGEADAMSKQIAAAQTEREALLTEVKGLQDALKSPLAAEPVRQIKAKSRLTPEIVTP